MRGIGAMAALLRSALALLVSAVIIASAAPAVAGLPSEDPTVARLRREFADAEKPAAESLRPRKTWYCDEHPAFKGSGPGVRDAVYFRFRPQGKTSGTEMYKNMVLPPWRAFRILRSTDDALMGYGSLGLDPIESTTRMYFIRAAKDGRLLVESAARAASLENPDTHHVRTISKGTDGTRGEELRATTYSECRLEIPVTPRLSTKESAALPKEPQPRDKEPGRD